MDRQTIDELTAEYELEPSIRDVYVEGPTDRSVMEWFFSEVGRQRVEVREVESIEMSADLLQGLGCENSNRGRVIALAEALRGALGGGSRSATCVADADFDRALRRNHSCELLLFTDYSCLEMYFFEARVLSKLTNLAIPGFPRRAEQILSDLTPPLLDLFSIRLANFALQWNMHSVEFTGHLRMDRRGLRLDIGMYIHTYLAANGRLAERAAFAQAVGEGRARMDGDPKHYINGHDFVRLLTWYVRRQKGFGRVHPQAVERSLYACAESASLSTYALFRSLLERTG